MRGSGARRILLAAATLGILGAGLVAMWGDRADHVRVRVWRTTADAELLPPEVADPELAVPGLSERPSLGVAFSGGGTRSATATLGQLRALTALGWLDQARWISANSGGAWAAVPFTYLPDSLDESAFLGPYVEPENLDDEELEGPADPRALGTAIHDAGTLVRALAVGRGDEAWADVVGALFLEPFGLHDNERFFTFHSGALAPVLAAHARLGPDDFQIVERADRPYLIVTGTLLAEQTGTGPDGFFPIEMTPLYTGVRSSFAFAKDGERVVVGGGYVESFGYDSHAPRGEEMGGRYAVRLRGRMRSGDNPFSDRYRFTLSDVLAVTSAAPLGTLSGRRVPNLVFPELRHWSVDRDAVRRAGPDARVAADEYQHGDGGDLDNLALMPLLVRRAGSVLVFVNNRQRFESPVAGCSAVSEEHIRDDVVSLFRPVGSLVHNVVFAAGEDALRRLCEGFAARRAEGAPLVHCARYEVVANPRYGIEPYRPDICFAYLDRVGSWIERLDPAGGPKTRALREGLGDFDTFPHYATFGEHGLALVDLDRERVRALSNLTAWSVLESAETVRRGLPRAGLPGTR